MHESLSSSTATSGVRASDAPSFDPHEYHIEIIELLIKSLNGQGTTKIPSIDHKTSLLSNSKVRTSDLIVIR